MNNILEKIYKTGLTEDAKGRPVCAFPPSLRPYEKGVSLSHVIRKTKATSTLEIGMAYGVSTLFICEALKEMGKGKHVAIDPFQSIQWNSIGLLNVKKAGFEKMVTLYEEPSFSALPKLVEKGWPFDLIFIDGMHLFDFVINDFFYSDKLLKKGGCIMFDDIWMPSIRKALLFILRNRHYKLAAELWDRPYPALECYINGLQTAIEVESVSYPHGQEMTTYCILRKMEEDDRDWEHFEAF